MLEEPWRLLEQGHNDINRLGIGCCRFSVKFRYFQLLLITWLGQKAAPVIRAALRGSRKHTRWEGRGVPLDRAPCGLGDGIKDIYKYLEVPLAGKRLENHVSRICGDLGTRYMRTASKMGRRLGSLYGAAIKVLTGLLWRF
jgi:tetrahydromethanopterin S-methyltransferase subunit G